MNDIWLVDLHWFNTYHSKRAEIMKLGTVVSTDALPIRESILRLEENSAEIDLIGAITENGPDETDILLGYAGVSYQEFQDALVEANELLPEGAPIYIKANTPGGDTSGVEKTGRMVAEIAQSRPVHVQVTGMLASAGIWVTAGATSITTSEKLTYFGSVGVATSLVSMAGMYEAFGIQVYDLTNAASKDKRPDITTEDGRSVVTDRLDGVYELFLQAILDGRSGKLTRESIEALHGRVVLSEEALTIGFVDSIEEPNLNITPEEVLGMDLEEFLKENPGAQADFDKAIDEAVLAENKRVRAEVKVSAEKVSAYVASDSYPAKVKEACLKAVTGEMAVESVQEFISLYDSTIATQVSADAQVDQADLEDVAPAAPVAKVDEAEKAVTEADERLAKIKEVL